MSAKMHTMTLSERQIALLDAVIREYVHTAEPVGSGRLAELFHFQMSPATIRLELAELEAAGLLTHPHTSAGRVPTEAGYRFYIGHIHTPQASWKPEQQLVQELRRAQSDFETCLKNVARVLAQLTGETAFAGVDSQSVTYQGLANLFSKPEFHDPAHVVAFSEMLDRIDEVFHTLTKDMTNEVSIAVGRENPFGGACTTILIRVRRAPRTTGVVGLVGPMRMDYDRNVAIIREMRTLIETI